jgi:hypothetical protein
MEKTKGIICIASSIAFVVLSVDQINKNQQIQSPTPQQQQASAQIIKATINSGFNRFEDFLKKPPVACVIEGRIKDNKNHDRACQGFIIGLSLLNSLSR